MWIMVEVESYPGLSVHTLPSLPKFDGDCIGRELWVLAVQFLSLLLAEVEVGRQRVLRELSLQL